MNNPMKTAQAPTTPKRGPGRPLKFPSFPSPVESRVLNLPPEVWTLLDELRGALTPSEWLFGQILKADIARKQAK